jgi:dynein heavy chain
LPDIARTLALQEDKFARFSLQLRKMLDSYHMLLASLDESETELLVEHLHDLKSVIRPGAKRLNWNALVIQDYLNKCNSVSHKYSLDI